ncbi:hypothetical protein GQ457_02G043270 [Hibiscus cannabinus]
MVSQEKLVASQEKSESRFQELEKQVSQLAQMVGRLESLCKLPSQAETDLRVDVSPITLKSRMIIEQQSQERHDTKKSASVDEANDTNLQEEGNATSQKNLTPEPELPPYVVQPPLPSKFIKNNKQVQEKEILDVFRKVEINIPLLEVIRKAPRYAHFLKDLRTNKRKLPGHEKVNLGEHVSVVLTRRFPPKLKNQGMFATPRKIHKISLKEVLSWTKRKKWRKYFSPNL